MKMNTAGKLLAATLTATLLLGCVSAPTAGNALVVTDQLMKKADPAAFVSLAVNPASVRVGDTLSLQLASAVPGHLYIVQAGSDGNAMSLVFPNAMDGVNLMQGGGAVTTLPRAHWRLAARGPAGVGYFVALVTERPQDLTALAAQVKQGQLQLEGPYGAAMAAVREVAP